jgi:peptidoglycan/xylan/chitin deacetylase (PgdA/CDA1 family)
MAGSGSIVRRAGRAVRNSTAAVRLLRLLPAKGAMVLRYHSVSDDPSWRREYVQSSLVTAPPVFDRQIEYLKAVYEIVPLDAIVDRLHDGASPPTNWIAITFDDGYADNAVFATPILAKHGATATFYVTTGAVGDEALMWTVRLRRAIMRSGRESVRLPFLDSRSVDLRTDATREMAIKMLTGILKRSTEEELQSGMEQIVTACGGDVPLERPIMMTWEQMRGMRAAGMTIGGHTVHHYNLPCQSDDVVRREVGTSKRMIEEALGEEIRHFAYPNGRTSRHFDDRAAAAAADAGFDSAVTSLNGPASTLYSPFCIPRLGIVPRDSDLVRLAADIEYGRRARVRNACVEAVAEAGIVRNGRRSAEGRSGELSCDGARAS